MPGPFEAFFFDLDGTLLYTLGDIAANANYALSQRGCPTYETERYRQFVGDGVFVLMKRILPEGRRTPEEIEALREIYMARDAERACALTRPYDGIPEMLLALRQRGVKAAVVSNKPESQVRFAVERFFGKSARFIENPFDFIIGGGNLPLKPDPAMLFRTADVLGLPLERCILAGDSGMDMRAAKSAGCTAVGVTWGFRDAEELLQNGADHIIHKPGELLTL